MSNTTFRRPTRHDEFQQETLFDLPPRPTPAVANNPCDGFGTPRVKRANRTQVLIINASLDELLPDDHPSRIVWDYVKTLDLTPLYRKIKAVERNAGRPPFDPATLLALWLYATIDGVGSSRILDGLCKMHMAYRWLCGDEPINYHTLSDFRTAHPEFLNDLLTDSVAVLIHEDLVTLNQVAQDGMRVRASAGTSSFRRGETLEQCLVQAQSQVDALQAELDADPATINRRRQAAQERAAREKQERIERAKEALKEIEAKKAARGRDSQKHPARASTTDPDARKMKMADGGFRPAHNVQFATDTDSQVIVGVEVTNSGSDAGEMSSMKEQIETRYEKTPAETLVDGGFASLDDIDKVSTGANATTVYAPIKDADKKRKAGKDPFVPQPGDTPALAAWRQRMGTAEAKEIYKRRAATAECVNAIARNRGLQQFRVRGLKKVQMIAVWFAIAHNMMRTVALRAERAIAAA